MNYIFTLLATFASSQAFAQAAPAKGPSTLEMLIMPIGFVVILYFFVIRPQQKKQRDQDTLMKTLKVGDEVVTSGGIIGRVKSIADQFVTIDLLGSASMKVLKSHISSTSKALAEVSKEKAKA